MKYGLAVLGESGELYLEAAVWGREQNKRLEKNEKARAIIRESLAPMLEEKRKILASRQNGK